MRKYLLYIFIIPILAFTFTGGPGGWYQQTLPDIGNRSIADMVFTDSLIGYIITSRLSLTDSSYVLKTINGGENWNINNVDSGFIYKKIQFIDQNTGYIGGTHLIKTTDGGNNWITVSTFLYMEDIYILNEDTMWYAHPEFVFGGIFRTTNGGLNWIKQGPGDVNKIYMINKDSGYAADGTRFRRTTNSGLNWTLITGQDGFQDMHFVDNSTGWKCNGNIKKTTDGGDNWIEQSVPSGGSFSSSPINKLAVLNKDTLWGAGGVYYTHYPNNRGVIWRTTNGGVNWGFQIPDTNININKYYHINLTDKNHIWAYAFANKGLHTITGGNDTTYYTDIQQISNVIPSDFILYQNYPNPFNPSTTINYEIRIKSEVRLIIFDISGRLVQTLVDQQQSPGSYSYNFDASHLSSGLYFYQLQTGDYRDTKKMLMIK